MRCKYKGKRTAHGSSKRLVVSILALALVIVCSVGGTLAWLNAYTQPLTNTFVMGKIVPNVDENFDDYATKSNVKITNTDTSNIPAFIRVALVPTWQTDTVKPEDSEPVGVPASLDDLNITWGTSNKWVTDGEYYYYTVPVPAGASTENLINEATVKMENGYRMNLQIIVDAIQPTKAAVEAAWGVDVTADQNGNLSINDSNLRPVGNSGN